MKCQRCGKPQARQLNDPNTCAYACEDCFNDWTRFTYTNSILKEDIILSNIITRYRNGGDISPYKDIETLITRSGEVMLEARKIAAAYFPIKLNGGDSRLQGISLEEVIRLR